MRSLAGLSQASLLLSTGERGKSQTALLSTSVTKSDRMCRRERFQQRWQRTVRKSFVNLRRSVVKKIVKELRKFTTPVFLRESFSMGVHIEGV